MLHLTRFLIPATLIGLTACAEPDGAPSPSQVDALEDIRVEGPLPQDEESHAFGGAAYTEQPEDLAAQGYVEEEFLISGDANVYTWLSPGAASVRTGGVPYTTRILVRRPQDRADFSGRVVVEMLNPSNLLDLNIGWAIHHDEFVRSGDAWVGVTSKPVAVQTLQTFDPDRYGALDWTNPLPLDHPANCEVGGSDTRENENGLVWDMNTDVARWLRSRSSSNPFLYGNGSGDPHPVEHLYGWGYSQTGSFLFTYIQAVRRLAEIDLGEPPFDGYLVAVTSGPRAINQCAGGIDAEDPRRVIRDAGVPVVYVMTQSDYRGYGPPRRDDGDEPGDRYRHYQLAGAGHATPEELLFGPRFEDIERGGRVPPALSCNEGPRSRYPGWAQFNAVYRNLKEWAEEGRTPPPSRRIEVDENGDPILDEHGNVTGGVRTPLIDVPTATWMGNSTGESFCRIAGHEIPFSPEKLAELYPSQEAYLEAFDARADALVEERFLTPEDAEILKAQARSEPVR